MTVPTRNEAMQILPDSAPFSTEQRQWLDGFFAGLLGVGNAGATALSPAENAAILPAVAEEEVPWHDPSMAIADRKSVV